MQIIRACAPGSGLPRLNRRPSGVPVGALLVGVSHVEDRLLLEGSAADLEADG